MLKYEYWFFLLFLLLKIKLFLLLSCLQVWELFYESDRVRDMLERLIKEESLRTYLFTYSHVYNSISMKTLSEMFELPKSTTHSIISKMIINEELMASLDDPTQTVVMHRSEPSRLQSLALQLADKVNNFVDSNERIFEMKQGKYKQFYYKLHYLYNFFFLGNFFPRGGNQNQGQYHRQNFGRQGGGGQDWNRQRRENRAY